MHGVSKTFCHSARSGGIYDVLANAFIFIFIYRNIFPICLFFHQFLSFAETELLPKRKTFMLFSVKFSQDNGAKFYNSWLSFEADIAKMVRFMDYDEAADMLVHKSYAVSLNFFTQRTWSTVTHTSRPLADFFFKFKWIKNIFGWYSDLPNLRGK